MKLTSTNYVRFFFWSKMATYIIKIISTPRKSLCKYNYNLMIDIFIGKNSRYTLEFHFILFDWLYIADVSKYSFDYGLIIKILAFFAFSPKTSVCRNERVSVFLLLLEQYWTKFNEILSICCAMPVYFENLFGLKIFQTVFLFWFFQNIARFWQIHLIVIVYKSINIIEHSLRIEVLVQSGICYIYLCL
jgi:hypothetical protein